MKWHDILLSIDQMFLCMRFFMLFCIMEQRWIGRWPKCRQDPDFQPILCALVWIRFCEMRSVSYLQYTESHEYSSIVSCSIVLSILRVARILQTFSDMLGVNLGSRSTVFSRCTAPGRGRLSAAVVFHDKNDLRVVQLSSIKKLSNFSLNLYVVWSCRVVQKSGGVSIMHCQLSYRSYIMILLSDLGLWRTLAHLANPVCGRIECDMMCLNKFERSTQSGKLPSLWLVHVSSTSSDA